LDCKFKNNFHLKHKNLTKLFISYLNNFKFAPNKQQHLKFHQLTQLKKWKVIN
jgi:hypothetical protein